MRSSGFLIFLIFFLLMANRLMAVPAKPGPVKIIQPDGTEITIFVRGDEKINWIETADGHTLMYDSLRYVVYATKDTEGNLKPSPFKYFGDQTISRVQGAQQFLDTLRKGLFYSKAQINTLRRIWDVDSEEQAKAPVFGDRKTLCILMNYPDLQMVNTPAQFDALMNQAGYSAGGAKGSVRDYFKENSYGQIDLQVTVAGPYTAQNGYLHYSDGKNSNGGRELALEAINAADDDVDFREFAVNGVLQSFHMIFAGYGAENGNPDYIWSHKWQLASNVTKDGVRIRVYSCSPERRGLTGSNITYIGVICHEMNHTLGSPDYYDTAEKEESYSGTGRWDLMADGTWNDSGRTPAHINMVQKIQYGWVIPEELTAYREVTGMPNSAKNSVAYTIEANGDMYVLENRQRTGFDANLPGSGLLIYHVHKNFFNGTSTNNNRVNASHPQHVYPVCASRTAAIPNSSPSSYGNINTAGCPFPGTSGKTSFTDNTVPAAFYWSGSTSGGGTGKPLANITEANGLISFSFMNETQGEGIEAALSDLSVSSGDLDPVFDTDITDYTVHVDNSVARITVSATATDVNATVTGTGNYSLIVGNNAINVVVTSGNGMISKTYSITVVRKSLLSNDASLGSILVDNAPASPKHGNATIWEIAVEFKTNVTITATCTHHAATIQGDQLGAKQVLPGVNMFEIGVTAENGRKINYCLEITVKDLPNSTEERFVHDVAAYPNPASDQIVISGLDAGGILSLFDSAGRLCLQRTITSSSETVSVGSLSRGNYFVRIVKGRKHRTIKIAVEN